MAFSLVQHTKNINQPSGTALTFPQATTAGNLLVCCIEVTNASPGIAFPSPWVQGPSISVGSTLQIWYIESNAGGLTSVAPTFTVGTNRGIVFGEFSGGGTFSHDVSGDGTHNSTGGQPFTVSSSGAPASGELVVAAFATSNGGTITAVYTPGSGYATVDTASGGLNTQSYMEWGTSGGGTVTATATDNRTEVTDREALMVFAVATVTPVDSTLISAWS